MNTTVILLELLGKSAVILSGATLCAFAMHRASAARRHLVWLAAFAALLVLPLTKLVPSHWRMPVSHAPVPISAETKHFMAPLENLQPAKVSMPAAKPSRFPDWQEIFLGTWGAGCAVLLAYRLLGSVQLARLKKRAAVCNDKRVIALAREIVVESGMARSIDIRFAAGASIPMTWGIWNPVLVLPPEAAAWDRDRLAAALRHEFAHIARGDCLVRLAAQIATAFYWPNLLAWFASRSLQMAQEEACDDLVLRAGVPADEYATLLLDAGRKWAANHFLARHAIAMARPAALERRVTAIVDEARDRRPAAFKTKLAAWLAFAASLALCAIAQVSTAQDAAPSAQGDWPPAMEKFVTVEYAVPSQLITAFDDGFTGPDGKKYATAQDLLMACGVEFPAGASASYLKTQAKLIVRNSIDNQNLIGKFYNLPAIPHPAGKIKLPDAILPKVSLKDATVGDCLNYFHKLSIDLDTKETDPQRKGVNIVLKLDANSDITKKKVTLELTNVSYREAFKKFADLAGLYAFSTDYAIELVPLEEAAPYNATQVKAVYVAKDGTLSLNSIPVASLQELEQKFRDAYSKNPDLTIVIDTGSELPGDRLKALVEMLKKIGITKVAVHANPTPTDKPAGVEENSRQLPKPVDIDSDNTNFENGIATAKGHAVLKYTGLVIKADEITYDRNTDNIVATGHASLISKGEDRYLSTSGGKITFNMVTKKLGSDGKIVTSQP